jgi:hypothetical protein
VTSCTSLFFIKTKENSNSYNSHDESKQYFEDLQVRAWLIEKLGGGDKKDDFELSSDGDETDYEEEFYFDKNKGCFRCGLVPGKYLVLAEGEGIYQFSETFEIGEEDVTEDVTPQAKQKKIILVKVCNGVNGEVLSEAIIRFKKKDSRQVYEQASDIKGGCPVTVEDTGTYLVEVEKKGFISSRQEFFYTKINLDMDHFTVLMMPVEVPTSKKPIITDEGVELPAKVRLRMIIHTDHYFKQSSPVIFIKGSNVHQPESKIEDEGEFTDEDRTYVKSVKVGGKEGWYYYELQSNQDEWFRLVAQVSGFRYPKLELLDKHMMTNIKMEGVKFSLYSDNRELGHMSPTYKFENNSYWDIGYINPLQKKFMQSNMFVDKHAIVTRSTMMTSYFRFMKYLNTQNQYFNISLIFGFNEGTFKFDDYYITQDQFMSSLKQLDVQWFSERLPEDGKKAKRVKKTKKIENDVELFQTNFTKSYMNIFGEISLKQVTEKITPHIGVTHKTKTVSK